MKPTLKALLVVVAAFAIGSGIFGIAAAPVLAQMQTGESATGAPDMSMGMGQGGDFMSMIQQMMANHKWGMINSIQNDEQGQPAWIVGGHWMMEMGSAQNSTGTSNTTSGGISHVSSFDAMLNMVRLNGSAMHNHKISNFTQTGDATFDSNTNTTTITGTATITLREGPVPNVPMKIEIAQDKVIAITPDAASVQNHFGNTPIYGIVISPEMIRDMMMEYGEGMHMMDNMTGMGGGMMQGPSGNAGEPPSESVDAGESPPMEGNMTMTNSTGGT